MKIAAVHAIAALAREDVPDEVDAAYVGRRLRYGPEYIVPVPFDPRLISSIPPAVAQAAMDSGVAQKPIASMQDYKRQLSARLDPTSATLQKLYEKVAANPKRVVFAEGEQEKSIRAAISFKNAKLGTPILVGREKAIQETVERLGLSNAMTGIQIHNAGLSTRTKDYCDLLYKRVQRKGVLYRDVQHMVNLDRNIFASLMVALGDADAMVTGLTRSYHTSYDEIATVLEPKPGELVFGLTLLVTHGRAVFIADTTVHETPTPTQLADIAVQTAAKVRQLGQEPRVALLSYSNFGHPATNKSDRVREAVAVLDQRNVDFEYDGEMAADVALDEELLKLYPFTRLSGPANVLIMPGLYAANIAYKLLAKLGGGTTIGPILTGLSKPAQIVSMDATVTDMVNMAVLAGYDALK